MTAHVGLLWLVTVLSPDGDRMLDHQLLEDSEVVKAYCSEARGLCFRARIYITPPAFLCRK